MTSSERTNILKLAKEFYKFMYENDICFEEVFIVTEDAPETTYKDYFGVTIGRSAETVTAGVYYYKGNKLNRLNHDPKNGCISHPIGKIEW